jgi:hypothetical protein
MNRAVILLPALAAAQAPALQSAARAACVLPSAERPEFDAGPIPVYVSSDGLSLTTLAYARVGDPAVYAYEDEVRWVRAAIDAINAASADTPRLYYAGLDQTVPAAGGSYWTNRNPGITISTYGACQYETPNAWASSGRGPMGHTNKCAIRMNRGATQGQSDACATQGTNEYWWVDPDDDDGAAAQNHDFMGIVVHEMLHCLALGHTDDPQPNDCDPLIPPTASSASVMYTGNKDNRRRLRKDDIQGLRSLYGDPARTVYESTSDSSTPGPVNWIAPSAIHAATLSVNTPLVLASAAANYDEQRLAGLTNSADQVRYFTGTWGAWDANAATGTQVQTSGGGAIFSYDHVAVARGRPHYDTLDERRIVAWVGGSSTTCCGSESETTFDNYLRYRVFSDGTWKSHGTIGPTRYKNLGAGYDPRTDHFVVAYIDFHPLASVDPADQRLFVRTIKAWNGGGGCTQALTTVDHVLDVGDIACDFIDAGTHTQCVIPVTTAADDGPELRFVEGEIETNSGFECFIRNAAPDPPLTQAAVYGYGQLSSAFNARLAQGVMLGAYAPGASGAPSTSGTAFVYTMNRDAAGILGGTMANSKTFDTNYWPLHVGSQSLASGSQRWRVITY